MNPRTLKYAASLAILVTFATPSIPASALAGPAAGVPGAAAVTGKALFGGTVPLVSEQRVLGRKLAIVRLYYMIGQKFTTPRVKGLMAQGTTVLASLDVPSGHGITYASITAGNSDKEILSWLTQADHAAVTYHLPTAFASFQHEANAPPNRALGTPAQFVAAWDHIHALAARAHLDWNTGGRLRWALILEHYGYFPASQRPQWSLRQGMAANYWPGTANVNVVAADGYNRGGCSLSGITNLPTRPTVSPGSLFSPVLTWARAHGKPVFLAEWGSAYYPGAPAFQANFITQMKSYVLANPRITAAMYWDDRGNFSCRYAITGRRLSLIALAAMGRAMPRFIGR
jgi:hypothetical protein